MKLILIIFSGVLIGIISAVAIVYAMPDHAVEFSSISGKCKKVEYRGHILPDGCKLVEEGKIARYETINGY